MTEEQQKTLHKEIDLIESAIERMARNSFVIKGWSLSLLALVATLSKLSISMTVMIILIPIFGFWWLDSFYLRLERAFRKVYESRVSMRTGGDWVTDTYRVNCGKFLDEIQSPLRLMFSSSTFPFYGSLVAILLIVFVSQVNWNDVFATLPCACHCQH